MKVTSLSLSRLLWNEPSPQSGDGGGAGGGIVGHALFAFEYSTCFLSLSQ